ncbi:hypothetical protein HZ994_03270 [Akkermansiaceae bacterium]|nr:hypothetical protein HZ994_03270 [Akkermansiaceae bacterium]
MNPTPPMLCGILLAAMLGAGISHHWFVQGLVSNSQQTPAAIPLPGTGTNTKLPPHTTPPPDLAHMPLSPSGDAQKEFFQGLLAEIRSLRNENRNLIDQVAETNRDIMKMEFRLDTPPPPSAPLPTSEQRDDRSELSTGVITDDDFTGVLPPRASPVYPLED